MDWPASWASPVCRWHTTARKWPPWFLSISLSLLFPETMKHLDHKTCGWALLPCIPKWNHISITDYIHALAYIYIHLWLKPNPFTCFLIFMILITPPQSDRALLRSARPVVFLLISWPINHISVPFHFHKLHVILPGPHLVISIYMYIQINSFFYI